MIREGIPPLSLFERSPVTDLIIQRLRDVPIGALIEYAALSEVSGEPMDGSSHLLRSAREILWKEGIMFGALPGSGLKRLDDEAKVGAADWYLTKARNAGRRSRRALQATDILALAPAARARYWLADVRAGLFAQFSGRGALNAITKALAKGEEPKKLREAVAESLKQF